MAIQVDEWDLPSGLRVKTMKPGRLGRLKIQEASPIRDQADVDAAKANGVTPEGTAHWIETVIEVCTIAPKMTAAFPPRSGYTYIDDLSDEDIGALIDRCMEYMKIEEEEAADSPLAIQTA